MLEPGEQLISFRDYLELDERAEQRHEYVGRKARPLPQSSVDHSGISAMVGALLSKQLREKRCRVYSCSLRVRVRATGLATYPDATVICDRFEADPDDPKGNTASNPRVIVEVLAPSTEKYDRGEKRHHYQQIPSLRELVLVAHDVRRVEVWSRNNNSDWIETVTIKDGTVHLASIDCDLPLPEIYRDPLAR